MQGYIKKESNNGISDIKEVSEPTHATSDSSGIKIKGINRKVKIASGKRLRSNLEKATKRMRTNKRSPHSITMKPPVSSHDEVLVFYHFINFLIQFFSYYGSNIYFLFSFACRRCCACIIH